MQRVVLNSLIGNQAEIEIVASSINLLQKSAEGRSIERINIII